MCVKVRKVFGYNYVVYGCKHTVQSKQMCTTLQHVCMGVLGLVYYLLCVLCVCVVVSVCLVHRSAR